MFTQFLENRKMLFTILVVALLVTAAFAQQSQKTGYVSGSIGFIDKSEGFIPSPNLRINLVSNGKKKAVRSDENGDYLFVSLPTGKYCVSSIQDDEGNIFQIDSDQSKCFEIKKKKTTRFDIIILKD